MLGKHSILIYSESQKNQKCVLNFHFWAQLVFILSLFMSGRIGNRGVNIPSYSDLDYISIETTLFVSKYKAVKLKG